MKKYYKETTNFKTTYRPIVEGLDTMLNAYPERDVLVQIRHLDIVYGSGFKKFRAINDLSLNIYQGEVLGLVGESGSGKSTTGRAIVGLTPYQHGHIKLEDVVVPRKFSRGFKFGKKLQDYKKTLNYMANKVQMIFQDPANSLNPNKNIEKVVSEGLDNLKNSRLIALATFDLAVLKELSTKGYKKELCTFLKVAEKKYYSTFESSHVFNKKTLYTDVRDYFAKANKPEYKELVKFLNDKSKEREKFEKMSDKALKKHLIVDILKQVGLDKSVLSRYPLEFSGGQQQRIGISRSIVLRPKMLVADEPISALDVSIQAQVVNIFNELKEKFNLTILFIAHDLRMVEYISDRIAVIYKGTLLEVGPTHEVVKNPLHPYTKSLLDAVPSIESKKGSLIGFVYDPSMHKYTKEVQPVWNDLGNKHYVFATKEEISAWKANKYDQLSTRKDAPKSEFDIQTHSFGKDAKTKKPLSSSLLAKLKELKESLAKATKPAKAKPMQSKPAQAKPLDPKAAAPAAKEAPKAKPEANLQDKSNKANSKSQLHSELNNTKTAKDSVLEEFRNDSKVSSARTAQESRRSWNLDKLDKKK